MNLLLCISRVRLSLSHYFASWKKYTEKKEADQEE